MKTADTAAGNSATARTTWNSSTGDSTRGNSGTDNSGSSANSGWGHPGESGNTGQLETESPATFKSGTGTTGKSGTGNSEYSVTGILVYSETRNSGILASDYQYNYTLQCPDFLLNWLHNTRSGWPHQESGSKCS